MSFYNIYDDKNLEGLKVKDKMNPKIRKRQITFFGVPI